MPAIKRPQNCGHQDRIWNWLVSIVRNAYHVHFITLISNDAKQKLCSAIVSFILFFGLYCQYLDPNENLGLIFTVIPVEVLSTLTKTLCTGWLGLRTSRTPSAMPAVALLLVGSVLPDRMSVRGQTKSWGLRCWTSTSTLVKKVL